MKSEFGDEDCNRKLSLAHMNHSESEKLMNYQMGILFLLNCNKCDREVLIYKVKSKKLLISSK